MKNSFILCLSFLLLSGCASTTQQVTNKPAVVKPQVSATIEQLEETPKGLKRKVAIARFTNETRHGSSALLDDNNDRIGRQASDILAARLTESGKFLLFERQDLSKIKTEQDIAGITSQIVGADYLIVGSISEFGRNVVSDIGIFSRTKKQRARAVVNVRLVDVSTGQIIFSEEGTGEALSEAGRVLGVGSSAGYDAVLDDQALSAAISKLISNLIENLLDRPWVAYVLDVQQEQVIISGGKSQGLKQGDELIVMKRGKQVKNSQTGIMIELPGVEVAKLKVIDFSGVGNNEVSICRLSLGNISEIPYEQLIIQEIKK
ncbi:MAG: CsgG/HfaB family protein [Proteobacteria bacterium]|nr:CsgG/HfaB family protein [Pseudomonadota bacterium]